MSLTHTIVETMSQSPSIGYTTTFILAMIESLAVIGSLIPGAITMTAAGTLIGTGILSFSIAFPASIVGALLGDYISFYLGYYYRDRAYTLWPLSRFPHWIEKGKHFFENYGVWALVIGRFFGPARSMVPLVAGMLAMPSHLFMLGIVPSAILWSIVYLTPGIIIGAVSTNFPAHLAIEFLIEGIISALIVWTLFYWITTVSQIIARSIDQIATRSSLQLNHGAKTMQSWQQQHLKTPDLAISNVIKGCIFSVIFVAMCFSSHYQGVLTTFDDYVYSFILSLSTHTTFVTSAALAVLGYYKTFILASVLLACLAMYQKQWYRGVCFIATMLIAVVFIKLSKHSVGHLRPEAIRDIVTTFSFPSGHTGITAAFLFFFSILLKEHTKARLILSISWLIVIIMALSRMLLGVHWLSDVIGGATLGLASAHLAAAAYYAKSTPLTCTDRQKIAPQILIAVLLSWAIMMPSSYPYTINQLTRVPQTTELSHHDWIKGNNAVPHYRNNRLGIPSHPFNVQTTLSIDHLQSQLEKHGWKHLPSVSSIRSILLRHSDRNNVMPFLNLLHNNKPPVLIMSNQSKPAIVLRLWDSGAAINGQSLYLGTVNEVHPSNIRFLPQLRYHRWEDFTDGLEALQDELEAKTYKLKSPNIHLAQQLHWNRIIMLIE